MFGQLIIAQMIERVVEVVRIVVIVIVVKAVVRQHHTHKWLATIAAWRRTSVYIHSFCIIL